jgi:hypothetical protein
MCPLNFERLHQTTILEDWTISKMTRVETKCHEWMRHANFSRRWFAIILLPLSVLAVCQPLIMTQTSTFEEADELCLQRFDVVIAKLGTDSVLSRDYWENSSAGAVNYAHIASVFISLAGLLLWLFCSPHQESLDAAPLDRKLGSFFGFLYLGSVFAIVFGVLSVCTSSKAVHLATIFLFTVSTLGISLLATNLLCHRYLLERASIINAINTTDDGANVGWFSLKNLNAAFIWEVRTLYIAGVCMFFFVFGELNLSLLGGAMTTMFVLVMDSIFSIIVTYIFLKVPYIGINIIYTMCVHTCIIYAHMYMYVHTYTCIHMHA